MARLPSRRQTRILQDTLANPTLTGLDKVERKRLLTDPSYVEEVRADLELRLGRTIPLAYENDLLTVQVDQDTESDHQDRFRVLIRELDAVYFYVVLDYGALGMDQFQMRRER